MKSKVSIVIPCYNDVNYIEQAVNSALAQTYENKEIIVVDDGSNEETKAVLEKLKIKISKLITQENRGQSSARNNGISVANGDFIAVLDSDDYYESTFCEKAIEIIKQRQDLKLISCYSWLLIDDSPKRLYKPLGGEIDEFLFHNAAIGNSLFRKSDWASMDGYDEEMTNGWEDWEFYIRLLAKGGEAYILKEPLFNYRKRKNTTTTRANKQKYELWKYIFTKHKKLYVEHYESFLEFFLSKIESEEQEKLKSVEKIDFKLGNFLLTPCRKMKNLLMQTSQ